MFYYNIRTDNISLFLVNRIYHFSSLLFVSSMILMVFISAVIFSVRVVTCGSILLRCSVVFSFSRWNVTEIPRTGEMECKMFIFSSKSLLKDSPVLCGLSGIYREFGLIWVVLSLVPSIFVLSGVAASMWISVHMISSGEICGDTDTCYRGDTDLFYGVWVQWQFFGRLVWRADVGCRMFNMRYWTRFDRIRDLSHRDSPPSFVTSALFHCLDNRLISGDICSSVAFVFSFCGWFFWWRCVFRPGMYLTTRKLRCRTQTGPLANRLLDFILGLIFSDDFVCCCRWGFGSLASWFARCVSLGVLLKVLKIFCDPNAFRFSDCSMISWTVFGGDRLGLVVVPSVVGFWLVASFPETRVWLAVGGYKPQNPLKPPAYFFLITLGPVRRQGHRALLHAAACCLLLSTRCVRSNFVLIHFRYF